MPDLSPLLPLRIRKYEFTIPRRFVAGHQLSAAEASALNQVLVENIRNNLIGRVARAEGGSPTGVLSLAEQELLQQQVTEYARQYQFREPVEGPPSVLETTLVELARQQAEAEGRRQGLPAEGPAVQLRLRNLLSDPQLQARARELMAERQQLAERALAELLLATGDC